MAGLKIKDATNKSPPELNDLLPISDTNGGVVDKNITIGDLVNLSSKATFNYYLRTGDSVYHSANGQGNPGTLAFSVDTFYALPFLFPRKTLINKLGVNVTIGGSAGSVMRVGIYDDTGNIYPNNLIVDSGAITTTGTGLLTSVVNTTINTGLYWMVALVGVASPTVVANSGFGANSFADVSIIGEDASGGTGGYSGYTVSQTYGALPGAFPGSASLYSANNEIPVIFFSIHSYP